MDYSKDALLSDAGLRILKDRYLTEEEQSPQDAFYRVSKIFSDDTNYFHYISNIFYILMGLIHESSNGNTWYIIILYYINNIIITGQ